MYAGILRGRLGEDLGKKEMAPLVRVLVSANTQSSSLKCTRSAGQHSLGTRLSVIWVVSSLSRLWLCSCLVSLQCCLIFPITPKRTPKELKTKHEYQLLQNNRKMYLFVQFLFGTGCWAMSCHCKNIASMGLSNYSALDVPSVNRNSACQPQVSSSVPGFSDLLISTALKNCLLETNSVKKQLVKDRLNE